MENIVYNELLIRGHNVDVGIADVFAKNWYCQEEQFANYLYMVAAFKK